MRRHLRGLALGGGGIKAYAQVGALKNIHQRKLHFDAYSGTSMGALVATLLAVGIELSQLEAILLKLEQDILDQKLLKASNVQVFPLLKQSTTGLIKPDAFIELLKAMLAPLKVTYLRDVKAPLIISAVDLISGKLVYFTNRKAWFQELRGQLVFEDATLIEALQASCSFPMVFETMNFRDLQLVDGGVLLNLPVEPLINMGIDQILAISMEALPSPKRTEKVRELGPRILEMMAYDMITRNAHRATLHLNLHSKDIGIFSFGKGREAIALGERETQQLDLSPFKPFRKRFFF
jgi:NTE family protein